MTNRQPGASPFPFSSVMMDIQGLDAAGVQYLHALGRDRLALYGVNPLAASDPWRAECFALLTESRTMCLSAGIRLSAIRALSRGN